MLIIDLVSVWGITCLYPDIRLERIRDGKFNDP